MRKDQIKPITYLKNRTADLVGQVSDSGDTVIITQNGEARVAVMGVATYDAWRQALAMLKLAAHAQADVEAGRVLSQADAFATAAAAIDRVERDG